MCDQLMLIGGHLGKRKNGFYEKYLKEIYSNLKYDENSLDIYVFVCILWIKGKEL